MKRYLYILAPLAIAIGLAACQGQDAGQQSDTAMAHFNPNIDALAQDLPLFGLYAPANPRGRGGRGGRGARGAGGGEPAPPPPPQKTPAELARDALAYTSSDFIFDGSMEGAFRGYDAFVELSRALFDEGLLETMPTPRLTQPLAVKMHEIAPDPELAAANIARQLNLGVSTVVFVGVESAQEVRTGLAAMRLAEHGGTRPDDVGDAPELWGMSDEEYRRRADVWPLNPEGELVNWTIVESLEGLANLREIAAEPGIGVLFPGAGTLRGVFTNTDENGETVRDAEAWEAAIQDVLAACKEFDVACGYPATEDDIEMRMDQGFSVFIMSWGEAGFRTIDLGRAKAAAQQQSN